MNEHLNTGIKDLIDNFPVIERILTNFGIGCAPCNVGTCLLKDIVTIHNLAPLKEQKLMAELEKEFSADRDL